MVRNGGGPCKVLPNWIGPAIAIEPIFPTHEDSRKHVYEFSYESIASSIEQNRCLARLHHGFDRIRI